MDIRTGDKIRLVIIALILAAALLLWMGAAGNSQVGRYQVNLGGGVNPVVLDTATGDWRMFDISTGQVKQRGHWAEQQGSQY